MLICGRFRPGRVPTRYVIVRFVVSRRRLWRMPSSGTLRRVALVRTDVLEQRFASINSVISVIVFLRNVLHLHVTANLVPSSLIFVTMIMEAPRSSERRFSQGPHSVTSQKTAIFGYCIVRWNIVSCFLRKVINVHLLTKTLKSPNLKTGLAIRVEIQCPFPASWNSNSVAQFTDLFRHKEHSALHVTSAVIRKLLREEFSFPRDGDENLQWNWMWSAAEWSSACSPVCLLFRPLTLSYVAQRLATAGCCKGMSSHGFIPCVKILLWHQIVEKALRTGRNIRRYDFTQVALRFLTENKFFIYLMS
jgi:hypothetical protein